MKIRKVLLIIAVLITSLGLNAQSTKYDKENEEILLDGEYYAKLVKSKHNGIGLIKNFSIQNRDGEELIFFKYRSYREWDSRNRKYIDKAAYDITFINGLGKVYIKKQFTVNSAMKLVTSNNLIMNDKVDPEAEKRFISVYRGSQGNNQEVKVEVSDIDISNNEIIKEGNKLGKFIEKTKTNNSGVEQTTINVYLTSGEKIATATTDLKDPSEWSVYTSIDDKTTEILYESSFSKEKLFNWLILKKYIK
mgnify:CR=1 FL=1|tara:strand:+ start:16 stop:762 length:747 start_codon:yes stop_codon:yes gene_type:complete